MSHTAREIASARRQAHYTLVDSEEACRKKASLEARGFSSPEPTIGPKRGRGKSGGIGMKSRKATKPIRETVNDNMVNLNHFYSPSGRPKTSRGVANPSVEERDDYVVMSPRKMREVDSGASDSSNSNDSGNVEHAIEVENQLRRRMGKGGSPEKNSASEVLQFYQQQIHDLSGSEGDGDEGSESGQSYDSPLFPSTLPYQSSQSKKLRFDFEEDADSSVENMRNDNTGNHNFNETYVGEHGNSLNGYHITDPKSGFVLQFDEYDVDEEGYVGGGRRESIDESTLKRASKNMGMGAGIYGGESEESDSGESDSDEEEDDSDSDDNEYGDSAPDFGGDYDSDEGGMETLEREYAIQGKRLLCLALGL